MNKIYSKTLQLRKFTNNPLSKNNHDSQLDNKYLINKL